MSRHHVSVQSPYRLCVVGWDNSMRTFFCQLYRDDTPENEDDSPHEFIGYEYGEVQNVAKLCDWLGQKGVQLEEWLVTALKGERDLAGPRTSHQVAIEQIVTGRRPPDAPPR